jgi:N6-adenosine-specific RNA methylase IME4
MQLTKWNNAKKAIAECKTIDEIKNIRDKAEAMRAYAKQIKEGLQVQNDLAEIKLRAERRAGEMLKETNISKNSSNQYMLGRANQPTTLKTIGITKDQSSNWQKIADIPEEQFEEHIIDVKESNKEVTTAGMLKVSKGIKHSENIELIKKKISKENIIIKDKYDNVILDPPWMYGRKYDANSSRVASPYPEQTIEEINNTCKDFFKNDCVLWLWTTHKFIFDAKGLLDKWGFEYKGILTWNKERLGMGSWLRMQCEFCLLGIKGKPVWNMTNERDIITEARREHSRKPVEFYDMIKSISYGTIFEYYSREKKDGIITGGIENGKY